MNGLEGHIPNSSGDTSISGRVQGEGTTQPSIFAVIRELNKQGWYPGRGYTSIRGIHIPILLGRQGEQPVGEVVISAETRELERVGDDRLYQKLLTDFSAAVREAGGTPTEVARQITALVDTCYEMARERAIGLNL